MKSGQWHHWLVESPTILFFYLFKDCVSYFYSMETILMPAYSQISLAEGKGTNKCLIQYLRNCAFNEVSSSNTIYPAEGLVVTANGASCNIYVSSLRQNVAFWYKQQMAINTFITFLRYTTNLWGLIDTICNNDIGSNGQINYWNTVRTLCLLE